AMSATVVLEAAVAVTVRPSCVDTWTSCESVITCRLVTSVNASSAKPVPVLTNPHPTLRTRTVMRCAAVNPSGESPTLEDTGVAVGSGTQSVGSGPGLCGRAAQPVSKRADALATASSCLTRVRGRGWALMG